MTLIELLVVLVVMTIVVAFVFVQRLGRVKDGDGYARIRCVNNLKQTGLAFRIWEGDNNDKYPMAVRCTQGGAMEYNSGPNAFRSFQVMSNELSTPKVLMCPMETDNARFRATNFNDFCNSNISYFVGLDAAETNATMILSGDHNITDGTPLTNGLLALTTNRLARWTKEVHNQVGNVCLADGSVWQDSTRGLQSQIAGTGVATNRLLMPIFGP